MEVLYHQFTLEALTNCILAASSTPGPNAPLSDDCHNSTQPVANAESAFAMWTAAGFPASKLVLGVPSYGYISKSHATQLVDRDQPSQDNDVQVISDDGSSQVQFNTLISEGALKLSNGSTPWNSTFIGAGGFTRYWDACSSTPFLHSTSQRQVVTYDDPQSLFLKAAFVRSAGMLGVNLFDIHGDTDSWDLVDSLRHGLGITQTETKYQESLHNILAYPQTRVKKATSSQEP